MTPDKALRLLDYNSYPHMCRDDHEQIGHGGDSEVCPLCALIHDIARHVQIAAEQAQEIERLRRVVNAAIRLREATRIVGDTKTECKVPGCICHAACDFDAAIAAITVDHKP